MDPEQGFRNQAHQRGRDMPTYTDVDVIKALFAYDAEGGTPTGLRRFIDDTFPKHSREATHPLHGRGLHRTADRCTHKQSAGQSAVCPDKRCVVGLVVMTKKGHGSDVGVFFD